MNRRHFIIKLPKQFVSVFDILLIIVSFYGAFNWPGGFVWFLLLCLSPLQHIRWVKYDWTDLQWTPEQLEKLTQTRRTPHIFNMMSPRIEELCDEVITKDDIDWIKKGEVRMVIDE